jgi:hypothetical protein
MKLSKKDLQMHLLKQAINYLTPRLIGSLKVQDPKTFQGQIIARAWARVERAIELDDKIGLRGDGNFANMARAVERVLVFLTEEDNYYRRWLGLLLQEITREVHEFEANYSFEDAIKTGARPLVLKREEYERHRGELIDLALSGYLTRLEQLTPEERDKLKGGWYTLEFPERKGSGRV